MYPKPSKMHFFVRITIAFVFIVLFFLSQAVSETRKEWEATVDIPLTSYWEEDIVAVAKTQIGYEESKTNFVRENYGKKGYTRYGDWYGYKYMDWCVSFVSFCAYYAGIPLNLKAGNINGLIKAGKRYNSYHLARNHEPEKGDIFFRTAEDEDSIRERIITHCGIVEEVSDTLIYTIEGNVDNKVVEKAYFRDDPVLCSYISIWDLMRADGIIVLEEEETEKPDAAETTALAEAEIQMEQYSGLDITEEEYYLN